MSAQLSGSFDPEKVIFTVGPVVVSGFSDGDYLTAARSEDNYFMRAGADGHIARSRNANKSGTIECRTLSTSLANDLLSGLFAVDNLVEDAKIVVPIGIADLSGRKLAACSEGWLQKVPDMVFAKEPSECIWMFACADLSVFFGGNN